MTPAQPLAVVVPADSHLEIEAMVSNRDIGFVHNGQEAEIKIDTFTFTRYGLLSGKVLDVSQDAITVDNRRTTNKETTKPGTHRATSEPKGQELNYAARVSLDRSQMQVEESSSTSPPAWRSRSRSKPDRAGSSAICSRRCSNTDRRRCGKDRKHASVNGPAIANFARISR